MMSMLARSKWLLFLLGFLLIANMALLLYIFVFGKGKQESRSESPSSYLTKELKLTQAQEARFREMKDDYMKSMRPVWDDIRKSKDSLYTYLNDAEVPDSTVSVLTARIAEKNRRSDEMQFRHFRELRKICTPTQQTTFDTLIPRMISRMWGRGHSRK